MKPDREIADEALRDTTFRVKLHYRNVGLQRGWPWARWQAFCRHFEGCTEREVAALFNIDERELWVPERRTSLHCKSLFNKQGHRVTLPTSLSTYLQWVESAILEMHGIVSKPVLPLDMMHLKTFKHD